MSILRQKFFLRLLHTYSAPKGGSCTQAAHTNPKGMNASRRTQFRQRERSLNIAKRFQRSMTLTSPACCPRSMPLQNWTCKNHLARSLRDTRALCTDTILRSSFQPAQATNFGKIHRPQSLLSGGKNSVNAAFWRRQSRIFSAYYWQQKKWSKKYNNLK